MNRSRASTAGTTRLTQWWLDIGDELCPHCGQLYLIELEYRCPHCDQASCRHCRCAECAEDSEQEDRDHGR